MSNSLNTRNFFIQKLKGETARAIQELIDLCHEEPYLLRLLQSSKLKCVYTASYNTNLVGIFIAWRSEFHPHCTYFRILIPPLYHQLNVEKYLLNKVEKLEDFKLPLQTSIWETATHLRAFYEGNGFTEIRRTYMPLLDVQTTKPIFPTNESHNTLYNLQTLSEIISKDTLMKKLAQLVKTNYEKTHLANPVATYNLETWREMILVNDLIADGSFLFLNEQEEIIAYSFLHTSEKNNTLELGWCGTNTIQNLHLLQQLVIKQITYANKHGYSFLQGEFDSTSGYGIEILKSCPFQPCPTWITYQK